MGSSSQVAIPPSNCTVTLSVVDTTSWAYKLPCSDLFLPRFPGLETFDVCSLAFLITHNDRHVLFDLGIKRKWENLIPGTVSRLKESGTVVKAEKELVDILRDGGIDPVTIDAAIWSHIHWDHTGNLASFPSTTELIVGPGIVDRFMPGWPEVPDAHFRSTDVAGRKITGLEQDRFDVDIGGMRGYDFFGDGSFYLLDAPGHSLGHINALARTSADPSTFIFLAADSVHLAGEIRPSEVLPLPDEVDVHGIVPRPCPAEHLLRIHPRNSRTVPYLGLDPCFPENLKDAEETIESIQKFDADDRVLVLRSHDVSMYQILEYYPASANDWKQKGWKLTGRWAFLTDLRQTANRHEQEKPVHETTPVLQLPQ